MDDVSANPGVPGPRTRPAFTYTVPGVRFAVEWLVALSITAVAAFLFLNGSFFSTFSALHIDLSINLTAAHALRDGANPYGVSALRERAHDLGGPTNLIYGQLFTSYIQPPTSALSLLPFSLLPWREATRVYLYFNHVLLFAAVALSMYTLRPTLPARWVIAVTSVILMGFSQIYGSFALGQVDATILFLLSAGFWGYVTRRPAVAGTAIACAAAIKLIPALLLLYFLWKRDYRAAAWGAGVGLALLLLSAAYIGPDVYKTYLSDVLPALTKGSTHYSNASFGAVIARAHTPEVIRGISSLLYLDEVPSSTTARIASIAVSLLGLATVALVTGRTRSASLRPNTASAGPDASTPGSASSTSAHPEPVEGRGAVSPQDASLDHPPASPEASLTLLRRLVASVTAPSHPVSKEEAQSRAARLVFQYYLVVAVGLMISSVTWEFYVIWLLPVFLAAFLSPAHVLPAAPFRWIAIGALAIAFVGLNYPGDFYLFDVNDFFYHPQWVPGVWAEDRVGLYHHHLDLVLYLRLAALLLTAATLSALVLHRRHVEHRDRAITRG